MKIFDARSDLNQNKTHSQARFILNYSAETKLQVFIVGGFIEHTLWNDFRLTVVLTEVFTQIDHKSDMTLVPNDLEYAVTLEVLEYYQCVFWDFIWHPCILKWYDR